MAEKGPDVKYYCFDCKKIVDEAEYKQHEGHNIEEKSQALEKSKECLKTCLSTPDEYDQMIKYLQDLKEENKTTNCPRSLCSGTTIKIASMNLNRFHLKNNHLINNKASIYQCLCDAIINNHVSVIAFQEIGDNGDALSEVLTQLRESTGDDWGMAVSKKYVGQMFQAMEYGAFIWCRSSGVDMASQPYPVCLKKANGKPMFVRHPYVGEFTVFDEWDFSLVSFHLKSRNGGFANTINDTETKALHMVVDDVQRDSKKDVILLRDFNRSMEIHPDSELGKKNYTAIFKDTEYTNMARIDCYDNIIIPRSCRECYCEDHEVTFPNTIIEDVKFQNGKIQIIDKLIMG